MRLRFKDVSTALGDKITNISDAKFSDETEDTKNLAFQPHSFSKKFLDKRRMFCLICKEGWKIIYPHY